MVLDVFADESSQNGHDHLVLGGVALDTENRDNILANLQSVRNTHNLHREIKWGKVSASKLEAYKDFVDCFFHHLIHLRSFSFLEIHSKTTIYLPKRKSLRIRVIRD